MKKATILSALMIMTALCGGIAILTHTAAAQAPAQASPWKDRAEYDTYEAIGKATDPAKQIELVDKYLAAYPQSKVAEGVLAMKLQALQKMTPVDVAKTEDTAAKLLAVNPKQLYALIVLNSLFPQTFSAQDPNAEQKLTAAADYAQRGLAEIAALAKPANVSEEDFKKQRDPLEAAFHQTAGFVALQKKDYPQAQEKLHKSAELNPIDAAGFYRLGLAYLTPKPPNYELGVWTLARAVSITGPTALPAEAKKQVSDYVTGVYEARHGSTEGLDAILAQAASAPFPPSGFEIKVAEAPAPEPEPVAPVAARPLTVKAEELSSYDVIQKYLQSGGDKEADTWTLLKGSTLTLPGKVISATPVARPKVIRMAVAPELANQAVRHDVEVTLAAPLAKAVAKGDTMSFEGVVDSYTAKPFVLRLTEAKVAK